MQHIRYSSLGGTISLRGAVSQASGCESFTLLRSKSMVGQPEAKIKWWLVHSGEANSGERWPLYLVLFIVGSLVHLFGNKVICWSHCSSLSNSAGDRNGVWVWCHPLSKYLNIFFALADVWIGLISVFLDVWVQSELSGNKCDSSQKFPYIGETTGDGTLQGSNTICLVFGHTSSSHLHY